MLQGLRERLTYANVVSTLALFLVIAGGSAVAGGLVGKNDIKDNAVRTHHIRDGEVSGADAEETSFDPEQLRVGGAFAALIRDVGDDGDTLYGPISGRAAAEANFDEVGMGMPDTALNTPTEIGLLDVRITGGILAAGEERTFAVVRDVGFTIGSLGLECTITAGTDRCEDQGSVIGTLDPIAVRVESEGAGLTAGEDARVGVAVRQAMPAALPP